MRIQQNAGLEFHGEQNDWLPNKIRPKLGLIAEKEVLYIITTIDLRKYLVIGKLLIKYPSNKIWEYWD